MADQDTTVTVENGEKVNTEVETTQVEDESLKTGDDTQVETDTGTDEEGAEGADGKTETETEEESEFKKRFSQFEGETPEEYLKNLEEAYANSSTEGQRLSKEAKDAKEQYDKVATLIANNPDFAKALSETENAPKPPVDPALAYAKQQMEAAYEKDWNEFTQSHPELAGDQALTDALIDEMDIIAQAHEKRGRTLSMAEGLKKAWISLGREAADNKENVVNKTKEQASKATPNAKPGKASDKTEFTQEQIAVAKKMGLTPEQLAKYNSK